MNIVFIDTSALVALFDKSDERHTKAATLLQVAKSNKLQFLLSDYIFDEAITTVLVNSGHETAVRTGTFILSSKVLEFIWLNKLQQQKSWEYFQKHNDKNYSFTDCTSFILMKEMGIEHFFAFDRDFLKAGFIDFSNIYSML